MMASTSRSLPSSPRSGPRPGRAVDRRLENISVPRVPTPLPKKQKDLALNKKLIEEMGVIVRRLNIEPDPDPDPEPVASTCSRLWEQFHFWCMPRRHGRNHACCDRLRRRRNAEPEVRYIGRHF